VARTKKKRAGKTLVPDRIVELETAIAGVRDGRKTSPRTARLLAAGIPRMAQKVAEEATEVVIEAVRGERSAVVNESVDLLYNLVVLWSGLGISASEIWAEMDRRQALLGIAEKLPKELGTSTPIN
jgi:phosphoribosyl-ATP pyrophosphohydrolase